MTLMIQNKKKHSIQVLARKLGELHRLATEQEKKRYKLHACHKSQKVVKVHTKRKIATHGKEKQIRFEFGEPVNDISSGIYPKFMCDCRHPVIAGLSTIGVTIGVLHLVAC